MTSITLLGIAGSLRQASTNRGLLRAAQAQLPASAHLDIANLTDIPFYNQDIAENPAAVSRVLAQIGAAVVSKYKDTSLASNAWRKKVLFSDLAHSMHSKHSSTSCPVAASISRNRSRRDRTRRAALALLMEFKKGRTYFRSPPSLKKGVRNA